MCFSIHRGEIFDKPAMPGVTLSSVVFMIKSESLPLSSHMFNISKWKYCYEHVSCE